MQKKQLTLVIVSLLVVVLSVSLAYFTAQIIGKGKDVSVSSADLKIIFTDSDGAISGSNIEPGWSDTKTFTVENNSKSEYKYNIVIKDLLNTFVTNGYLQYKITSTNGGYNMTEFKDVPKSGTATDTILAYSVVIPNGVTQSYTIEFKYANDESVDQSDDMGRKLSGTLFITEGTEKLVTLLSQLLADKTTRPGERTDFSTNLTNDNTNTLYTSTEDSKTVYYFAGNATDNWVKFGKNASNQDLYWRIIRTNSDGGVRLLYHGTSTTAVYCNDRSTSDNTYFGAYTRLITNKTPSYDCATKEDKFTVDSTVGNGKLTYPIALMTADEVSFAGGVNGTKARTWYYYNSANGSSTGSTYWWLLSPNLWIGSDARVFGVNGLSYPGRLDYDFVNSANGVRPVISLKSCIKYSTGNGSANEPYTIKETTSGC